jgi:hypothetical protein
MARRTLQWVSRCPYKPRRSRQGIAEVDSMRTGPLTAVLLLASACSTQSTIHPGSSSGSSTGATAGATTGVTTGTPGSTTANTGSTTGAGSTTGGTSSASGSGSTSSNCFGNGQFVGAPNAAQCCSGAVDAQGYCASPTSATSTGSTTSASTTGNGTTGGGPDAGLFGGGWHPPDSGYQVATVGDGGTATVIDPTATGGPAQFGGPDAPSAKPTMVYPPDGVLLPPNMNALEIHFIPGAGQTLFELAFHSSTRSYLAYLGCTAVGGGCVYSLPSDFWSDFVNTARGKSPVTFTLRGVNGSAPGAVGTSASRTIAFSDQDLTAGIYFWNTGGTVERYDWGLPGANAETWMDQRTAGATFCVGCHVLTRDGDKAVVGKDIPSPASYNLFDVATRAALQGNSGTGDFYSFSPDGQMLLSSDGVTIAWQDLVAGTQRSSAIVPSGTMPDWSPSGQDVVFARPRSAPFFSAPGVDSAGLEISHFDGSGFAPETTLVPFAGQNNYYPAYAPTGDWVVFNRSPSNSESFANASPNPDAGTVPDGELWAVASGGGAAIKLAQASSPGACSWPKWAPVVSDYFGGKALWLTFSSQRSYGLRFPGGQQTRLWMVGFDPARAAAGQDPSLPAFYLPFQDQSGGNHIAQWVTSVVRKACVSSNDCPAGDLCTNGRCTPPIVRN